MIHVSVMLRNRERFAYHATYRILCGSTFQSFGMSEKYGRHQFHLSNEQRRVCYLDFEIGTSHQAECVFTTNQLYLDVDLVQHVSLLKEDICVQATHHIDNCTLCRQLTSFNQSGVYVSIEGHAVHVTGTVFVVENGRQLRRFGILTVTHNVSSMAQ